MILNRLYELAVRENLLTDFAFETLDVPFTVVLGEGGQFLNLSGERPRPPKKGESRQERRLSVPRPHTSPASQGTARYFVDAVPRALPVVFDEEQSEKEQRRRTTFWQQIDTAADATDDPALRAVQAFGRSLTDSIVADQVRAAVAAKEAGAGDRVTFAYFPDSGPTILDRQPIRQWYADFFGRFTAGKQQDGPVGFCTITGAVGPLPTSHPIKLSGIPGGLPTGVSIVSFDKPAFGHYGLNGAANAAIGYAAADGYARGFQWLRNQRGHHFVVGGTLFLFWTRVKADLGDMMALFEPQAEQVEKLLQGVAAGKDACVGVDDPNDFYLLAIGGNSARAVIREYLERKLGRVRESIAAWFRDLRIADPSKEYQGRPNAAYPLWLLAAATVRAGDDVAADTCPALLHTAVLGQGLPDSVVGACLRRLEVEGGSGFRPHRMGLLKLALIRRGIVMTPELDPEDNRPPYLCGRLLALFERIQYKALGEVNSNVVDKFYGTFSANPFLVLDTLQQNARAHLKKMRTDARKKGASVRLERDLALLVSRVAAICAPGLPRPTFDRYERSIFSFGYYHQKTTYLFPPVAGTDPDEDSDGPDRDSSPAD